MGWRSWLERLQGRQGGAPSAPVPSPAARATPTLGELGLSIALLPDDLGEDACVGCGLCAAICPTDAIRLAPAPLAPSPAGGQARGWIASFDLDTGACIACELCMQVCPTDAIRLYRDTRAPRGGVLHLHDLRANAAHVQRGRRRSPLGPVPGDEALPPVPRRPAAPRGSPRPAANLGGSSPPRRDTGAAPPPHPMTLHPVETSTSEPTRLEHWAHPIDAPTDPDTADVEAVADLGGLLPDWTNPDETTGAFEELPDRIEDSRSQATQPIPGLPDPGDWLPPVSAQDAEDAEDIEPTDHPAEVDTLPVLSPVGRGEAEDTAPVPTVRPPGRPPRRPG